MIGDVSNAGALVQFTTEATQTDDGSLTQGAATAPVFVDNDLITARDHGVSRMWNKQIIAEITRARKSTR